MSIETHLREMLLTEQVKPSKGNLSDDALVRLSLISLGSDLPFPDDDKITVELINNKFLDDSLKITKTAFEYLKTPKSIKRLQKIGE